MSVWQLWGIISISFIIGGITSNRWLRPSFCDEDLIAMNLVKGKYLAYCFPPQEIVEKGIEEVLRYKSNPPDADFCIDGICWKIVKEQEGENND